MSTLYFGDNLDVMREKVATASVDLIYLDPPFNSNSNYNVLFDEATGSKSSAQTEAFQDTWSWGQASAAAYDDVVKHGGEVSLLIIAYRNWLGENHLMAYLAMMAVRIVELRRVIKPKGSLYLHCDPTASHYIKLILDAVFGHSAYRREIVWLRSKNPKGSQHAMHSYGPATDSILYYGASRETPIYLDRIRTTLSPEELLAKYPLQDIHGRYADGPVLRSKGMGARENLVYEYKGFMPGPAGWRMKREALEALDAKRQSSMDQHRGPKAQVTS